MNILILSHQFPPSSGGVQTHAYNIAKNLNELGEHVKVLTPRTYGSAEFCRKQNFKILTMITTGNLHMDLPLMFLYTLYLVSKWKIEVIYSTYWYPDGLVSLLVSKLLGVPCLQAVHGLELKVTKKDPFLRLVLRDILEGCAKVVALGSYQRFGLLELGIEEDDICILPEGVDLKKFKPAIDASKIRERMGKHRKIILSVGRLVKRKGNDMVIRALPTVLKRVPEAAYVVVGTGPEEHNLKTLVREFRLVDDVFFVGHIDDDDLPRYYNACDVFIMPNREIDGDVEGFGIVFLEASACHKPVVGGKSGGTYDAIKDGVTGILVEPLSITAISDALVALLTDQNFSEKLGRAGRKMVNDSFSYLSVARRLRTEMLMACDSRRVASPLKAMCIFVISCTIYPARIFLHKISKVLKP